MQEHGGACQQLRGCGQPQPARPKPAPTTPMPLLRWQDGGSQQRAASQRGWVARAGVEAERFSVQLHGAADSLGLLVRGLSIGLLMPLTHARTHTCARTHTQCAPQPDIEHWCVWRGGEGLTHPELAELVSERFKGRQTLFWVNPPVLQSVSAVRARSAGASRCPAATAAPDALALSNHWRRCAHTRVQIWHAHVLVRIES